MNRPFAMLVIAAAVAVVTAGSARSQEGGPSAEGVESGKVFVKMSTTKGDIILELDSEKAPITVRNFLEYVDEKFYDGTIFHSVVRANWIQGGGFNKEMKRKETRSGIKNEWRNGLKNQRGSICMARFPNQPDSATTQFLINTTNNSSLDRPTDGAGWAVFGKVVEGIRVVDSIKSVPTRQMRDAGGNMRNYVPTVPVVINSLSRLSEQEAEGLQDAARKRKLAAAERAKATRERWQAVGKLNAVITTDKGDIRLELYPREAPLTVTNFVNLAKRGYYDGLKFHRVIQNFMIQGGDPQGTGQGGPGYRFKDETSPKRLHDGPGVLSMANSGRSTNGSQFFITHKATPHLNGKHTVFGRVTSGQDVVNAITANDVMKTIRIEGDPKSLLDMHTTQLNQWNTILDQKYPRKRGVPAAAGDTSPPTGGTVALEAADHLKSMGLDASKFTTTPSGLAYYDMKAGTGETPTKSNKATVHCTGWLANGKKFYSTHDKGDPISNSLNGGYVAGFCEGVLGMKVGGKRMLVMPGELGYPSGNRGAGIPPNSTIVFEVELVGI
ncbi:MAG: peptidylprolyl isomerase [Planctomycetota bacterium]|nr:peptidylprolyl isomerase [Planctomycetota bacterium]